MLEEAGIETGMDVGPLIEAARLAEHTVEHLLPGQVMMKGLRLYRYALAEAKSAKGQ